MTKIYACLAGKWVCLNDDINCTIGELHQTPSIWWEENAPLYAPAVRDTKRENSFYGLNYIHIYYQGKDWRINPAFVQIVDG